MLVIDGHLDLAHNALSWNRDLKRTVAATRAQETGMPQKGRAGSTVSIPEMRQGEVFLSFATLFARVGWPESNASGYQDADIAHGSAYGQLAYYRILESMGIFRVIADPDALEHHVAEWQTRPESAPLGVVILMEGADPILSPEQLSGWYSAGLRILGLSHYGRSAYAHGTGQPGPLTERARPLLKRMEELGIILDASHLAEESFYEAMDVFHGPVLASHSNCRALVPGDRQLTDDMIRLLIARDAVIGSAMDAWMLYPGWVRGETSPEVVSLVDYVNHIDRVCQLAGNAQHAAIGTDLDGGYGREQVPRDLDTIVDLQQVPPMLRDRGYSEDDIASIMYGNWLRLLRRTLGRT